jgi:hypothetical protein
VTTLTLNQKKAVLRGLSRMDPLILPEGGRFTSGFAACCGAFIMAEKPSPHEYSPTGNRFAVYITGPNKIAKPRRNGDCLMLIPDEKLNVLIEWKDV